MMRLSAVLVLLASQLAIAGEIQNRISPAYQHKFQLPLTIPEVKKPLTTYKNPRTGVSIDFYEVEIKSATHSFYPNLGTANITAYDGSFPGPTFRVSKGRESVIRTINRSNNTVNFHVHGSYTRARK
jgi:bilirubin oxidase